MPADLPPGATRCRGRSRDGRQPCPGILPAWSDPGPDGRILSDPCTTCGREYVDRAGGILGQPTLPEPAA